MAILIDKQQIEGFIANRLQQSSGFPDMKIKFNWEKLIDGESIDVIIYIMSAKGEVARIALYINPDTVIIGDNKSITPLIVSWHTQSSWYVRKWKIAYDDLIFITEESAKAINAPRIK